MATRARRLCVALAILAGCSDRSAPTPAPSLSVAQPARPAVAMMAESQASKDLVRSVKARFRIKSAAPMLDDSSMPAQELETAVLKPAVLEQFRPEGAWLHPVVPASVSKGFTHPARVTLPARGGGAFELRDQDTGMWIEVALEGMKEVPAETADGYVVYRNAVDGGGHVIHRPHAEGTEDYIVFDEAPGVAEVRYRVVLGEKVAGLRLVENVLEFLDAGGAPRLRMVAPLVQGLSNASHTPSIAVDGCKVDTNPKGPWGESHPRPGSEVCGVRLSWAQGGSSEAMVVDPVWTTTGNLIIARSQHVASLLQSGRVLVAAGGRLAAELYDRGTGSWASTGASAGFATSSIAHVLPDGKVLMAGGTIIGSPSTATGTSELYDPNLGTWSLTGSLVVPRKAPRSADLGGGKILIAGGDSEVGAMSNAEAYSPSTGTWSPVANMSVPRYSHAIVGIGPGKALVAGGVKSAGNYLDPEIYDAATDAWSLTSRLGLGNRYGIALINLGAGKIVAVGGNGVLTPVYDVATGTWSAGGQMNSQPYYYNTTTLLGGGGVMVTGGINYSAVTELYDPKAATWTTTGSLAVGRMGHSATRLNTGEVLVASGNNNPSNTNSAELFGLVLGDSTCVVSGECASGTCMNGYCCESACNQPCYACTTATTGGPDGRCLPILAATDPNNNCLDSGSPTCTQNGLCDGAGACQLYPVQANCSVYSCTKSTDCTSGHCVDGVCCDTACAAPCQACTAAKKGAGVDGVCGATAADTDPENECSPDPQFPQSCKGDGLCDGTGQCRPFAKSGVSCDAVHQCQNGTLISAAECTGTGTCLGKPESCAPFSCADATSCATSCANDAQCADSGWCKVTDGTCEPDQIDGATCSAAAQCLSGNCVDGICCDGPCNGTCQSCKAAHQAGPPQEGHCAPVKDGADPYDKCADDGISSCKRDGTCNGVGACRNYAQGVSCGPTQCVVNDVKGQICDGVGVCVNEPAGVSCAPYVCSGNACTNPCASDTQCTTGFWCDAGTCRVKADAGAVCTAGSQCANGLCVEGVCCNTECKGSCSSCRASNKESNDADGTCGPAKAGTDPHDDCADDGQTSCLRDGQCDGFGACRDYAKGASCGEAQCFGSGVKRKVCDGIGGCDYESLAQSCGAFTCITGSCAVSCASDDQCATGAYCNAATGICSGKFDNGTGCTSPDQCKTGKCVDDLCCDTDCNGQCESCATPASPGTCLAVKGDPENGRPACKGQPGQPCTGACDGVYRQACVYPQAGTICATVCAEATETISVCDGDSLCKLGSSKSCAAYVCDGTTKCKTNCDSPADCASGNVCDGSTHVCVGAGNASCKDDFTSQVAGQETDCRPYRCSSGTCRDSCSTTSDCAQGYDCNNGVCTLASGSDAGQGPAGTVVNQEKGCGCRAPGSAATPSWAWLAAVGALAVAGARRRRPAA